MEPVAFGMSAVDVSRLLIDVSSSGGYVEYVIVSASGLTSTSLTAVVTTGASSTSSLSKSISIVFSLRGEPSLIVAFGL
jgi:hypothetical protein